MDSGVDVPAGADCDMLSLTSKMIVIRVFYTVSLILLSVAIQNRLSNIYGIEGPDTRYQWASKSLMEVQIQNSSHNTEGLLHSFAQHRYLVKRDDFIMEILRLAWSDYQTNSSLNRERKKIERAGFKYMLAPENGVVPDGVEDYDVIVVNSQFEADESFLSKWNREGTLITASSGYDRIDLEACDQANVTVVRTPEARASRVVDHTLALIQTLLRDVPRSSHQFRRGNWTRSESFRRINRLPSLSVGILGFGVIGQQVADRLVPLDPYQLMACDPHKQGTIENHSSVELQPLDELISQSNILTIHANLTDETDHLIDGDVLKRMKDPSFLINTARGRIVDFGELIEALEQTHLAGAGIDVYPEEPFTPAPDPLPDNLITTPHTAGFGPGLLSDLTDEIIDILKSIKRGNRPAHQISP